MNQQNMTKSKMLICWGLIVVGTILLLTQSGKSMPLLVGAALLFVGLLLSKGHLLAVVVLLAGIAAAALSLFFNTDYMDYTQLICGVLLGFIGFIRVLSTDISIADTPQQLYLSHCKRYGLTPNTVQFYFMSTVDMLYVAIADDGKLYSFMDGTRKSIPLVNIDRCEGQGLDSTNKSKYLTVVVYEKNGNHHNYYFSRTTYDFAHFTDCLNAIIEFRDTPTTSYAEQYERCEKLFALGGVDPKIYPEDMYNN